MDTLGITSSSVKTVSSLSLFLNSSIFSFGIDIPAAIGCPPNFPKISLHFINSSYILYSSIERPDPLAPSWVFVSTIAGRLYFSLILPAIIPAILS